MGISYIVSVCEDGVLPTGVAFSLASCLGTTKRRGTRIASCALRIAFISCGSAGGVGMPGTMGRSTGSGNRSRTRGGASRVLRRRGRRTATRTRTTGKVRSSVRNTSPRDRRLKMG